MEKLVLKFCQLLQFEKNQKNKKQLLKRRNFAQSGHPDSERQRRHPAKKNEFSDSKMRKKMFFALFAAPKESPVDVLSRS
jgi:hypothetical protein